MSERTIKFVRDYQVKAQDGPFYKSGQVVSLSQESANHFINRQAAEEYTPPPKAAKAEKPKAETAKEAVSEK